MYNAGVLGAFTLSVTHLWNSFHNHFFLISPWGHFLITFKEKGRLGRGGRGLERERNIDVRETVIGCLLLSVLTRDQTAAWVSTLTRDWTCSLSVYRMMLQPTELLQPTEPHQPGHNLLFFNQRGLGLWLGLPPAQLSPNYSEDKGQLTTVLEHTFVHVYAYTAT